MAVRLRLKRMGRRHRPFFRICAMDGRSARDGKVIEELGYYDPMVPDVDARTILKGERVDYWLGVGAQPTPKVGVLIKKYGTNGTHVDKQKSALERIRATRPTAPAPVTVSPPAEAAPAAEAAPPSEAAPPAESSAGQQPDEQPAATEAPQEGATGADETKTAESGE